jgi:uncharacterized membrane protein
LSELPDDSDNAEDSSDARALEILSSQDPDLEQIAEALPPERRGQLLQVIQSHRGWLPPPAMLVQYEQALPGLAERIVAMPEREQAHRHGYLDRETGRQFKIRRRGQDYALIAMVLVLAFAGALAWMGQPALAAQVVIATLVGVVGIFATGKWLDRKADKDDDDD